MIQTLQNIFKIPDLRRRILFTLGMLAIYRIGAFIPIPGINLDDEPQGLDRRRNRVLRLDCRAARGIVEFVVSEA
jgi:preprotein translocase subunit SecY